MGRLLARLGILVAGFTGLVLLANLTSDLDLASIFLIALLTPALLLLLDRMYDSHDRQVGARGLVVNKSKRFMVYGYAFVLVLQANSIWDYIAGRDSVLSTNVLVIIVLGLSLFIYGGLGDRQAAR